MSGFVCTIAMVAERRRWVDSFMATTRMAMVGKAQFLVTIFVAIRVCDYNLQAFRFKVRVSHHLVVVLLV
jgi:hypothetical protein